MFLTLFVSGLVLGCIYGLVALGYSLIYKASGLMSFTQGDIMTVGAYVGLTFFGYLSLPFPIAFLFTAAVMFCLGIGLERLVIRRLRSRDILPIYVVLATIAISYILQNATQLTWGASLIRFPSIFSVSSVHLFGRDFQTESLFSVMVSLVIMFALQIFMKKSKVGTGMRASAMDPMAAKACGISVNLCTGMSWALAACTAALGGILMSPLYGLLPNVGAKVGTKGFAAAVIGGYGNMYGSIVGGLILGVLEMFTAGYISSGYKDLFAYAALIVFLFIRPWGLFNERTIRD